MVIALTLTACGSAEQRRERQALERDLASVKREIQTPVEKTPPAHESHQQRLNRLAAVTEQYERIVKDPALSDDDRTLALRRLADLGMEREHERFMAAMENYEAGIARGDKLSPPTQNFTEAIGLYERLLKTRSKVPDRDLVLYQLASAYDQMGNTKRSLELLETITRDFPQSVYLQEVYFRLGEHYFDIDDLPRAEAAYKNGAAIPRNPLYHINTLYKLGWTYYLESRYDQSADTFRILLDTQGATPEKLAAQSGRPNPERPKSNVAGMGVYRDGLMVDALLMLARSFTEISTTTAADRYFEKVGDRSYRADVYQTIGDYLRDQQRLPDAVGAYQVFLKHFPLHAKALDVHRSMVEMYEKVSDFQKAAIHQKELVKFFEPGGPWMRSTGGDLSNLAQAQREKAIEALAKFENHLAQKEKADPVKAKPHYEQAIIWYRLFLKDYPQAASASANRLLLADCLYEIGGYEEAARFYDQVAHETSDPKIKLKAAHDALLSAQAELDRLKKTGGDRSSALKRGREMRENYQKISPRADDLSAFLFKEGTAFFDAKNFKEAQEPLEILEKQFPTSKQIFAARRLRGLCLYQLQDYSEAAEAFTLALNTKAAEAPIAAEDLKDLHELRSSALFKQAQATKAKSPSTKAAEQFLLAANSEAQGKATPFALFEAGRLFVQNGEMAKGVAAFERLASEHPQNENVYAGLVEAANAQRDKKSFAGAARDYLWAARVTTDGAKQKAAFYEAGTALEQAGDTAQAASVWDALRHRANLTKAEKLEYTYRYAKIIESKGRHADAMKAYQEGVTLAGPNPKADLAYYAGRCALGIAQHHRRQYKAVELVKPLQKNLKRKQTTLAEALKAYAKAVESQDAEVATHARFEVGEILEDFAQVLKNSPVPPGLSQQDKETYRMLMDEKAFPFEEKAIATYESNVQSARDSKVFNEWVKKSYDRLSKLSPGRYAKIERTPPVLRPKGELF